MSIAEDTIIAHLVADRTFADRILDYIDPSDHDPVSKVIFGIIKDYYQQCPKANHVPKEIFAVEVEGSKLSEGEINSVLKTIDGLPPANGDPVWLNDFTEKHLRSAKQYAALLESLDAVKAEDIGAQQLAVQKLLDANAFAFNKAPQYRSVLDLIKDYTVAPYLIHGLFRRGNIYSITGQTGAGKTAIVLALAMAVAFGTPLGDREVVKGRVLYLAGENPADTIPRIDAMLTDVDTSAMATWSVDVLAGRDNAERAIQDLVKAGDDIALIIIDTSTAYFGGDNENDAIQCLAHAKWMRSMTKRVPGNPAVIVCCHPNLASKRTQDFVPRGGGSFLNEMDANYACVRMDDVSILKQHGKWRELETGAVGFMREVRYVQDMPTVIAKYCTEQEVAVAETKNSVEEVALLQKIQQDPTLSQEKLGEKLLWNRSKVQRVLGKLRAHNLIDASNNQLTATGREVLAQQSQPNGHDKGEFGKTQFKPPSDLDRYFETVEDEVEAA